MSTCSLIDCGYPKLESIAESLSREITAKVKPPRAIFPGYPLGHPMGMPFDSVGQRMLIRKVLEYLGIIEEPGTLIELKMGAGGVECEICKVNLTSTSENIELRAKGE